MDCGGERDTVDVLPLPLPMAVPVGRNTRQVLNTATAVSVGLADGCDPVAVGPAPVSVELLDGCGAVAVAPAPVSVELLDGCTVAFLLDAFLPAAVAVALGWFPDGSTVAVGAPEGAPDAVPKAGNVNSMHVV